MFLTKLDSNWMEALGNPKGERGSVLEPGEGSGQCTERGVDQMLVVLEGEVLAEMAEEKVRIRSGNGLLIPAGVSHRFANGGQLRARTVSVFALPSAKRRRNA